MPKTSHHQIRRFVRQHDRPFPVWNVWIIKDDIFNMLCQEKQLINFSKVELITYSFTWQHKPVVCHKGIKSFNPPIIPSTKRPSSSKYTYLQLANTKLRLENWWLKLLIRPRVFKKNLFITCLHKQTVQVYSSRYNLIKYIQYPQSQCTGQIMFYHQKLNPISCSQMPIDGRLPTYGSTVN